MYLASHHEFFASQLTDRVSRTLGALDIGNGTPAADALAIALQLDLRMSQEGPIGEEVINGLSDRQIRDLADRLMLAIITPGTEFDLPLGTKVTGEGLGDLAIGGERWLLDAGKPGLHPIETMRRDAHGSNLKLLNWHIERLTRRLACRRLGLPTSFVVAGEGDHHLLEFPPFELADGVVLQRWANGTGAPRFCAALPGQILKFAQSIVADMRLLWSQRRAIAMRVAAVRERAGPAAAAAGMQVQSVCIDLGEYREASTFSMRIGYDAVDDALRDALVIDFEAWHDDVAGNSTPIPAALLTRREEQAALSAIGADGWIDDMAHAAAEAAPQGVRKVLSELARSYEVTFALPTMEAPLFVRLFWREGTITAEITKAHSLIWSTPRLQLKGQRPPPAIAASLPGRTLDEFVRLPFDCVSKIVSADIHGFDMTLELEVGRKLVHLNSGDVWPAPVESACRI